MGEIDEMLSRNLSTYVLDVLEIALSLPEDILDKFILPKKGVYLSNSIKPILNLEENRYYFEDGKEVSNLEEILYYDKHIIDFRGNVILTNEKIRRIKNILLDKPNLPVVALEFIIKDIENFFYNNTISNINVGNNDLSKLLKNSDELKEIEVIINIHNKDIYSNLARFINEDSFSIYEFIEKGNILVINKKCDYRIIEYYKLREQVSKL